MPSEPDHLSNEVAIALKVEIPGVPNIAVTLGTRSRFVAAADRLLGGLPDAINAFLDGFAAKKRARDATEMALINEEGKAAIARAYDSPAFGGRLADRFLKDQARKQLNREAVVTKTIEHLQEGEEPGEAEGELDDDWLNVFEAAAEKATSDRLRDMWGRVLAGEVRKPGSFSLSTLRLISELDAPMAWTFQKYTEKRISDTEIIKPVKREGQLLIDLCFLEAVGLLQGVSGSIGMNLPKSQEDYYFYCRESLYLRIKSDHHPLRLEIIYITRVGTELLSILPPVDPVESMTGIGEYFASRSKEVILFELGERTPDGRVNLLPVKDIKRDDPPTEES